MRAKKSVLGRVVYYCVVVLLLIAVVQAYGLYKENNFNEFLRSELKMGYSEFKRDDEITWQVIVLQIQILMMHCFLKQ